MGILDNFDIALESNDNIIKSINWVSEKEKVKDFIKKYSNAGSSLMYDYEWEDCVNEKLDIQVKHPERLYIMQLPYDSHIRHRAENSGFFKFKPAYVSLSSSYIVYISQYQTRRASLVSALKDNDGSMLLIPRDLTDPIIIKGYPGKSLPHYMTFIHPALALEQFDDFNPVSYINFKLKFLLINCTYGAKILDGHIITNTECEIEVI